MITYDQIRTNQDINTYIRKADESLIALGFTEHSFAHVGMVAEKCRYILSAMGYSEREIELGRIAAYLHDIGNLVNRIDHSQSGAVMAFRILDNLGMDPADISEIVTAIGNHDEGTGRPVSPMAAALILADKSDVRRNRVRNRDVATFDIHDRVNYSVEHSRLKILPEERLAWLELKVDTQFSSVMDFFEIFMKRMLLCRRAAERLGLRFQLTINGQQLI